MKPRKQEKKETGFFDIGVISGPVCFWVETPSLPTRRRRYPRGFAFYVADPILSIPAFL